MTKDCKTDMGKSPGAMVGKRKMPREETQQQEQRAHALKGLTRLRVVEALKG